MCRWLLLLICLPVLADAAESTAQDHLRLLDDADWQIRMSAAQDLAELRPQDRSSVSRIAMLLDDDDARVRRAGADALGEIGSKASKSVPQLVALFDDRDASVVAAAAAAVGKIGIRSRKNGEALARLMEHPDARVREASTRALEDSGRYANKSTAALIQKLGDPSADVRIAAAAVLGQTSSRGEGATPKLVRLLDDDEAAVRDAAQDALVGIGKYSIDALMAAMGSGDPVFSLGIIETLARIGSPAIPALSRSLENSGNAVLARRYAAQALARISGSDKRVVETLRAALSDDDADVRSAAVEALGSIQSAAVPVLPHLLSMSQDQREATLVRERAFAALVKIAPGNGEVYSALVAGVSDSNPRIHEAAIAALVALNSGPGSAAEEQTSQLVSKLRDGNTEARINAARLLGDLGPYAASSVAALIDVLSNEANSVELRSTAARSIGLIGSDAEAAVPDLIKALDDNDPTLRSAVLVALERVGPQQRTIPALMRSMRTGDLASRASAVEAVREFASARLDTWRPLLHQSDAPVVRNWLSRHEELYGLDVDDLLIRETRTFNERSYFDVLGGRAAIRETMQLELIDDPVAGLSDERVVQLSSIQSVGVDSHPFEDLLEDSDQAQPLLPLADNVPIDRFFAYFRNVSALRDFSSGGGDQLLRFEAALASKSVEYNLEQQFLKRFGFDNDLFGKLDATNVIEDLAIFSPDVFFVDGTDVTAIVNLVSPAATQTVLQLLNLERSGLYWAIHGDVLAISTSSAELELVTDLQQDNGEDSLGKSDEFLYMQQQLAVAETTEAYLYFSDAFIRKLISPATKIAQLRRMEARAEMELLASSAMLYLLDGNRKMPSKQQLIENRYVPPYFSERDYVLSSDLQVTSETYGALSRLKPLSANPVGKTTEREANAYESYVNDYRQYWRQFFDPIAIRLDKIDDSSTEMQTFILPLLDSRLYDQVQATLSKSESGRSFDVPVLEPAPAMMMSTNLSDDMRVSLSEMLAAALVEFASVDPEIFDSIGSGLHLAVQDSTPIVALGSGDVWGAMSKEMLRLEGFDVFVPFLLSLVSQPTTVLVELADAQKVRAFLEEAVARRAELGGKGEFHQLQNLEAWIYSMEFEGLFTAHLRLEIQGDYLLISNLPWSTQVEVSDVQRLELNGAHIRLNLAGIDKQLPALHTKVYTDYRAAAVDGIGYLYPLLESGLVDSVDEAIARHFEIFGFEPVHPGGGKWEWTGNHIESSEFGTAMRPVQPEYREGDRNFGIFPTLDDLTMNMQLEEEGLRAIIRWQSNRD